MVMTLPVSAPVAHELQTMRQNWGWLLAFGIGLSVLGFLAMGSSFIATLATVFVFGWLLVVGGAIELASALWARQWSGFFLHTLGGIVYAIVGFLMIFHPAEVAIVYTLLLAAAFFVGGLFRIFTAAVHQFPHWGWMALSGGISVLLGLLIWRQWPLSGLWVIGFFVGIELLFCGITWVMLALTLRGLPPATTEE